MILIYNLSPQKDAQVKMLCRKMLLQARSVEKDEYGCTLGYLLGLTDDDTKEDGEDFDDAMLYMDGVGGMLSLFLDQLRRKKIRIPLKAIRTDTNIGFSSYELHRELCAERDAIEQNRKAHDTSDS